MGNKRIFCLDFIRVVALFCIIWCHTNNIEYDTYLLEKVKWFLGKCGVPLFFTISGYLAFPQNKPIKEFFIHKIKRVVLPFVSWLIIYAVWAYFYGFPVVINGDILNEGSAHLWFIYVIIGLYTMVPILNPFIMNIGRNVLKGYIILWGITSLFPLFISYYDISYNEHNCLYTLNYIYGYIGYFLLGAYLREYGDTSILIKPLTSIMLLVISFILISIYFFIFNCQTVVVSDHKGLPMVLYSISMFGILRNVSGFFQNSKIKNTIIEVSTNSFGIYLCHMLIVFHIYPLIPVFDYIPDLISTLIFVIINLILSFIFVKILSRFRYSEFLLG